MVAGFGINAVDVERIFGADNGDAVDLDVFAEDVMDTPGWRIDDRDAGDEDVLGAVDID
jgi:hypothetical protein